ncbi:MAG TPA: DNA polymerase beta [Candidatus Desulfofervidus auxilii]|uniref:DNA polymerase beta n=1 Tax=Desulfofervidus auxilii TaxID=1621989 RepID=A0A7C1VVY8_DESA2|nr:DNA polymerase beta [Candidatus Desulfofervidus auxilii]
MKTLKEIEKILKENKAILAERFKVKEIGIFGSYVRGEQKEKSDVDILVSFYEPISLLKLVSLENFLSALTGVKIDIVPKEDIRPELKERILGEVIYL